VGLERLGLQFGKLSSITPGKSLGNMLEIPLATLLGGVAAVILARDAAPEDDKTRHRPSRLVLGCYLAALLMYFVMPMVPE
jgi:hypothetical protein